MNMRRLLTVGLLGLAAGAAPLTAGGAHAHAAVCRTDPVVTLSNGTQITMYADTQDSLSDIKSVYYELHIPHNVSVTSVQYDTYGYLEHLTVYADQHPGNFHTYTSVYTGKTATETAFAGVTGPVCQNQQTGTMTNTTPHSLPIQFHC